MFLHECSQTRGQVKEELLKLSLLLMYVTVVRMELVFTTEQILKRVNITETLCLWCACCVCRSRPGAEQAGWETL